MHALSDVDDAFNDAIVVDAVTLAILVDEELPALAVIVAVAVVAAAAAVPPSDV